MKTLQEPGSDEGFISVDGRFLNTIASYFTLVRTYACFCFSLMDFTLYVQV